jgi:hypothetical protein
MTGLLVVVFLALLALLAPRYGWDSRDGEDWSDRVGSGGSVGGRRHRLSSDARAAARKVFRALGSAWERQERAWGACWQAHQPWRGDDLPWRQGELHWREREGTWRLEGLVAPRCPPTRRRSSRQD